MFIDLVNPPARFQMIMANLFRDIIFKFAVCYLDDILVYLKYRLYHLIRVELSKLERKGFTLNVAK